MTQDTQVEFIVREILEDMATHSILSLGPKVRRSTDEYKHETYNKAAVTIFKRWGKEQTKLNQIQMTYHTTIFT